MLKNDVLDAMILVDTAVNEPLQTSKIRKTGLSIPRMACTINRNMDVMYYKTRHSEQKTQLYVIFFAKYDLTPLSQSRHLQPFYRRPKNRCRPGCHKTR